MTWFAVIAAVYLSRNTWGPGKLDLCLANTLTACMSLNAKSPTQSLSCETGFFGRDDPRAFRLLEEGQKIWQVQNIAFCFDQRLVGDACLTEIRRRFCEISGVNVVFLRSELGLLSGQKIPR